MQPNVTTLLDALQAAEKILNDKDLIRMELRKVYSHSDMARLEGSAHDFSVAIGNDLRKLTVTPGCPPIAPGPTP